MVTRYREALNRVEKKISKASELDPSAGHRTDRSHDATAAMVHSDVIIADNSAMTMDAVGLDKPVLLSMSEAMRLQSLQSLDSKDHRSAQAHCAGEHRGNCRARYRSSHSTRFRQGRQPYVIVFLVLDH